MAPGKYRPDARPPRFTALLASCLVLLAHAPPSTIAAAGEENPEPTTTRTLRIKQTTTVTLRPTSTGVPLAHGAHGYGLQGCYAHSATDGATVLEDGYFRVSLEPGKLDRFGVAMCLDRCSENRFKFAAVDGGDCFCAPSLSENARRVSNGFCSTPCAGDRRISCGGEGFVVLYSNRNVESGAPPSPSPTSPQEDATTTGNPSSGILILTNADGQQLQPTRNNGRTSAALVVGLTLFSACLFAPLLLFLLATYDRRLVALTHRRNRDRVDSTSFRIHPLPRGRAPNLAGGHFSLTASAAGSDDEPSDDEAPDQNGRPQKKTGKSKRAAAAAAAAAAGPPEKAHVVLGLKPRLWQPKRRRYSMPPPAQASKIGIALSDFPEPPRGCRLWGGGHSRAGSLPAGPAPPRPRRPSETARETEFWVGDDEDEVQGAEDVPWPSPLRIGKIPAFHSRDAVSRPLTETAPAMPPRWRRPFDSPGPPPHFGPPPVALPDRPLPFTPPSPSPPPASMEGGEECPVPPKSPLRSHHFLPIDTRDFAYELPMPLPLPLPAQASAYSSAPSPATSPLNAQRGRFSGTSEEFYFIPGGIELNDREKAAGYVNDSHREEGLKAPTSASYQPREGPRMPAGAVCRGDGGLELLTNAVYQSKEESRMLAGSVYQPNEEPRMLTSAVYKTGETASATNQPERPQMLTSAVYCPETPVAPVRHREEGAGHVTGNRRKSGRGLEMLTSDVYRPDERLETLTSAVYRAEAPAAPERRRPQWDEIALAPDRQQGRTGERGGGGHEGVRMPKQK